MFLDLLRKFVPVSFAMVILAGSFADGQVIQNDVFWKDTEGNPMITNGGGTIKVGDTWYWHGVKYGNGATWYNKSTGSNYSGASGTKVSCFSSKDLMTWKNEGDVFNAPGGWYGRCGVVYHAGTKKYVLVGQGGTNNQVVFASSDAVTGPFTQTSIVTPPGVANGGTGDQTVFQDDDGKAYIICSSRSGRSNWYILSLRASDYLAIETTTRIGGGTGREGNCMFKRRGRYYFVSSLLYGWNASPAYYISATNILGPYGAEKTMTNSEKDYCHITQTGFFTTVNGTEDTTVIFSGDRWSGWEGNGPGFSAWTPVTFDGTDANFNSLSRWTIDAVKGTWKVAPGNNYILNGIIEADRVVGSVRPWTGTGARNVAGSAKAGNYCMNLASGTTATQTIASLPNGTYEMSVWIQSSGSGGSCDISVSDFGGAEMKQASTEAMANWTQVRLPGIKVTSGKAVVNATNSGKSSCQMDDFSLATAIDAVPVFGDSYRKNPGFAYNPGTFSIQANGRSGKPFQMEVYTTDGRNVLKRNLVPRSDQEQFSLPENGVLDGHYFLRMTSGGESSVLNVTLGR
ncbi:MAG: family 43 glycosylhydrolase [Fibrobacteria bacterium]